MSTEKFFTRSAAETKEIARRFAQRVVQRHPADTAAVLAMRGDLGAGKTTFVQGFAEGLGIREVVNSPTFVIIRRFKLLRSTYKHFYHIDCYRLEKSAELLQLGFAEIIKNPENIVAVEWPEKIADMLPEHIWRLGFCHIGEGQREITFQS